MELVERIENMARGLRHAIRQGDRTAIKGSAMLLHEFADECDTIADAWEHVPQDLNVPELVETLGAVGLHVVTKCPVHPDSDHDPFDCPPEEEDNAEV
jgi:hypothetical protein